MKARVRVTPLILQIPRPDTSERYSCTGCTYSATKVSLQDVREGILDGSLMMIYKVCDRLYYYATGTIGDQSYA